jgi:pimeloyl-ACP methyl ester carboxylesterase
MRTTTSLKPTLVFRAGLVLALSLLAAGCAMSPPKAPADVPPPISDRALEDRILALDPERVSPADVKRLAQGPTPRIMLLHGGIYPVHLAMTSFGYYLVGMGYPEGKIRDFAGSWSHSPYEDADRLAGIAAWHYEKEGMPPMLIGHSQGGMQAVKVLHVLNGDYGPAVRVWNPYTDFAEDRTAIVEPLTRRQQPVVGMRLGYAAALGAGGAAFLLPNQWSLLGKLRTIPDTVEEFTGYSIDVDFWAWTVPGVDATRKFANGGAARVRNVTLPAGMAHVTAPVTSELPEKPAVRAWIEAYTPGTAVPPPPDSESNVLWAADVWFHVKKWWVIEAQRWIRAKRGAAGSAVAGKLE